MSESFDVIVVGGGVMGASISLNLARRGLGRILLLERESLCAGSTGRSVASVDLLTQHPCMAPLHLRSLDVFQHCAEVYGDECGWVQTGFALLGGQEAAPAIACVVQVMRAAGAHTELLCPADYLALDPGWKYHESAVISWTPDGGYVDPVLLTNAMANAARAHGVSVRQGEAVLDLQQVGERIIGVQTHRGEIGAGAVVVCAGNWSRPLLRSVGIDLQLQPLRHAVAVLACPPAASPRVSMMDTTNQVYARPETGGLTVCGSLDLSMGFDPMEPDDECGAPSMDYGMWVWERLVACYPGMEVGELRKGWSGPIEMSPDGQAMMGRLPLEGLFCACGFSGAGMKIAPAVGEVMAGLVAGDAATEAAFLPLRPTRFAEGQPLLTPYAWGTVG
jgi:sarcosine oxidase subunit beta